MKKIHLGKATDLYDGGTATFGIAKGNIQSVPTPVIRDTGGGGGGGLQPYFLRGCTTEGLVN